MPERQQVLEHILAVLQDIKGTPSKERGDIAKTLLDYRTSLPKAKDIGYHGVAAA